MGGNCYSGFAKPSRHEPKAVVAEGLSATLRETEEAWELDLTVPAAIANASFAPVTTRLLGETRLSAMAFEAPNDSDYDLTTDLLGNTRTAVIPAGPFASLAAGRRTIRVWEKK